MHSSTKSAIAHTKKSRSYGEKDGDGRPPRQDGGSAPVSRRSSDAYRGEPASTEAADPPDEGTVRGDPDVEKLAPP